MSMVLVLAWSPRAKNTVEKATATRNQAHDEDDVAAHGAKVANGFRLACGPVSPGELKEGSEIETTRRCSTWPMEDVFAATPAVGTG